MRLPVRLSLALLLTLSLVPCAPAQQARSLAPNATTAMPPAELLAARVDNSDDKKTANAPVTDALKTAPADPATTTISDPLVRVLVSKGVLSDDEGRSVSVGGTPAAQRERLASLLRDKGLITAAEFEALRVVAPASLVAASDAQAVNVAANATQQSGQPITPQQTQTQRPEGTATPKAPAATVIPAVAPIRVLQFEGAKREGLIPDIKLGSGARVKLYGFFKTGFIYDSSSPGGNDFPLPLFLGDTGPRNAPEFHIKARALRLGANFEWLDPAPKTAITGRIELDFEGDFTRAANRNISSIRSSQPSIRLAWARIDRQLTEKTSGFALFGQDWTPFGSSTVPNTIETTGFHLGFGNIYERAPQARFGLNYNAGGKRALKFQPEFAFVLNASGNTPANVADQLAFGERQGPDANRPEIQGRFVTQFQLDKAAGVVPAQLIVSFTQGQRKAIVTAANVPTAFRTAFPNGAEIESSRYGYSAEIQLPTRFVTVIGKYYNGADLRFHFGGQLFSTFNDTAGLTATATAASIDGSSTVVFGLDNGVAVIAPQRPVRGQGGFINFGFPLSRIFNADPKGRASGFSGYLHYGYDQATARDARRFGGRGKSDVFMGSLFYKLNTFVTFAYEQSLFRTRAANSSRFAFGGLPLFRGIPSRETHDVRSEFATIFTF